jgi:crotonobetainyl-CoA:carnitine CoA-transferase CaiB-like acyl-CoA transferase
MTQNFTGPHNDYFASVNRNKRGIILDLGTDAGQTALHELAVGAQGLITNLKPGTIKRFGLTYEALKGYNDKLVCVALTGYGLEGPYSDKPAFDYIAQALTGVMELTGDPGGKPTKAGYSAVDNSTGMLAAIGLLAKIIEGKGGQVDVSLFDSVLAQLNYLASAYLNHGIEAQRVASSGHPHMVPAQVFATRDGFAVLFISSDKFWRAFCNVVGKPDWADDPKYATMVARSDNRDEVIAMTAKLMKIRGTAEWVDVLGREGLVISGVETLAQALDGELAASRDMIAVISTPDGPLRVVGNPIKLSGHEQTYTAPPLLGEHTEEIIGGPVATAVK